MNNSPENNWTLNNISRVAGANCAKFLNVIKHYIIETTKVVEKSHTAFQEGFDNTSKENNESDETKDGEIQREHEI